jgi:hypothetical protein
MAVPNLGRLAMDWTDLTLETTSADEFLAVLDPNGQRRDAWTPSLDWVFRGQGNADDPLLPSALRSTAQLPGGSERA